MAKFMKLRRDGECADCRQPAEAGTKAYWFADERVIRCADCFSTDASAPSHVAAPTEVKELVHSVAGAPEQVHPATVEPAAEPAQKPSDVAGASAQLEYDKRSARERAKKERRIAEDVAWRAEIKQQKPVVGRIVTALTAKPQMTPESQATEAWKVGAVGERRVAEVLSEATGVRVMHDRLVPRSRANIDHLAIGPAGVFVIDAKNYTGQVEVRDVGGLLRSEQRLYVKNRDRSKLVKSMHWQMEVVRTALGEGFADVEVRGVLCLSAANGAGGCARSVLTASRCSGPRRSRNTFRQPASVPPGSMRLPITSVRSCVRRLEGERRNSFPRRVRSQASASIAATSRSVASRSEILCCDFETPPGW